MNGVDTNVFLRFAIDDNAGQHKAALSLLKNASEEDPLLIHPIVWIESEWVLRTRFKLDRATIADRLAIALQADRFVMPDVEACSLALADYRANVADLAECLLARLNKALGCRTTYTFDREAARLPDASSLASSV